MKRNIRLIINQISDLRRDFTKQEIMEAVVYLNENGIEDDRGSCKLQTKKTTNKSNKTHKAKPFSETTSKAILELDHKQDQEKVDVLLELDRLMRTGKILSKLEDIRRNGSAIDKTFAPGKSRKEAVPRFISLLAKIPPDQLNVLAAGILREEEERQTEVDEYKNLASFLIRK